LYGYCYNFRIHCCTVQTLSLDGAWAIDITAEHTGYTDSSVTAEHTGYTDSSLTAEHTGYTDLSVTADTHWV